MANRTYDSGLVRRYTNEQIQTISDEDRNQVRNYAIIVTQAAAFATSSEDIDVFTARSRQARDQWWKFWDHKKNDTTYIYYLVDMRDRFEKFTTQQTALNNKYPLVINITVSYSAEDPRQVALGTDDFLGGLLNHLASITRKFVLAQSDFVALHDIEIVLDSHLKQNDIGFIKRLGLRVFELTVEVELPQKYHEDLQAYKDAIDTQERDRRNRKIKEEQEKALADHAAAILDIEAAKNQALTSIEADHAEIMEQLNRRIAETDAKKKKRETQSAIQYAQLDQQVQRTLDELQFQQTHRRLLQDRTRLTEEQRTQDIIQLQKLRAAREQMRERIMGALEMLALMGLTPQKYPWIVQAVTAYINVDPDKGWMRLHELTSNILSENRASAKEALKQFYEVTRPAIEAGYVSPQELKEIVQMLIPALSGADMNNYFQTDHVLDEGIEEHIDPINYNGPDLSEYDTYKTSGVKNNTEDDVSNFEDTLQDVGDFKSNDSQVNNETQFDDELSGNDFDEPTQDIAYPDTKAEDTHQDTLEGEGDFKGNDSQVNDETQFDDELGGNDFGELIQDTTYSSTKAEDTYLDDLHHTLEEPFEAKDDEELRTTNTDSQTE